jgi:uncharacterized cupin superfamily protein
MPIDKKAPAASNAATGVQVVKFGDKNLVWEDYTDMPNDRTPGNPIGQHADGWTSSDGRITVGLWRRDADIGDLLGTGQCFDFVIDGEVTVTDANGNKHHAGPGDLLIYNETDTGEWNQLGPIKKFFIHVKD